MPCTVTGCHVQLLPEILDRQIKLVFYFVSLETVSQKKHTACLKYKDGETNAKPLS